MPDRDTARKWTATAYGVLPGTFRMRTLVPLSGAAGG